MKTFHPLPFTRSDSFLPPLSQYSHILFPSSSLLQLCFLLKTISQYLLPLGIFCFLTMLLYIHIFFLSCFFLSFTSTSVEDHSVPVPLFLTNFILNDTLYEGSATFKTKSQGETDNTAAFAL